MIDFTTSLGRTLLLRLLRRWLTPAGNQVNVPVTAAAITCAITFPRAEANSTYGVGVTPTWNTTVYVTNKTTAGCVVNFGTAAPGAGAAVDLSTFRTE